MKMEASDIAKSLQMRSCIERGIYTYGLKWLSLVLHIADSEALIKALITALVPDILAPELASVVRPAAGTVAR